MMRLTKRDRIILGTYVMAMLTVLVLAILGCRAPSEPTAPAMIPWEGPLVNAATCTVPPPATSGQVYQATVRYGPGGYITVMRPRGPKPAGGWPTVFTIFGGAWKSGSRTKVLGVQYSLAALGYASVAPDYRLAPPGGTSYWPTQQTDVEDALAWFKANAVTYGLNPNRVVSLGQSSGAQLAALLAIGKGVPAAGFYGSYSLTDSLEWSTVNPGAWAAIVNVLQVSPSLNATLATAASPRWTVTASTAPMFLTYGTADSLMPPLQTPDMAQALTEYGLLDTLVVVPGAGHGYPPLYDSTLFAPANCGLIAWLHQRL